MKGLKRVACLLLALALALSSLLLSGCDDDNGGEEAFEQVRRTARAGLWKDINSGKASSAGVAVLDGGEIVYSESFGMADRENSMPVTNETLFNMGSVSKTFVSTAVMVLVDEGKVELDAPVTEYITGFTMADPRYEDITVRMLMDHSSGMPGTAYANNNSYEFNQTYMEDTLSYLASSHLKAAPGETAPYCNDGFTLAELLVTRVSGQEYLDFLSDRVLEPLSLDRTGTGIAERDDPDYAAFYQTDTGKKVPAEIVSCIGAGGLSSTPEDLVRFADSFSGSGPKVLSDSSIAEMTEGQPSAFARAVMEQEGFNPEFAFGLGLDFTDVEGYREKGIKVVGKAGDTDDYHSMMITVPGERLSVAVMEAGHGSSAQALGFEILDSLLEAKGLMEEEEAAVSAPPQPQPIPAGYLELGGVYASKNSSFQISFSPDGSSAELTVIKGGVKAKPVSLTYYDGFLHAGSTKFKLISVDGRDCFVTTEWGKLYIVYGQRLTDLSSPMTLASDIDGAQWLRRNVKPFEEIAEASGHLAVSSLSAGLPGYVDFNGIKRIESPVFAGMAIDTMTDSTELTLFDRDGRTWARVSDMVFSPADGAAVLEAGSTSVTIGGDGYNEWLLTGGDFILTVAKPDQGRLIVFSPDGSVLYDSVMDSGDVYVPRGSLIELSGYAGDTFEVSASQ